LGITRGVVGLIKLAEYTAGTHHCEIRVHFERTRLLCSSWAHLLRTLIQKQRKNVADAQLPIQPKKGGSPPRDCSSTKATSTRQWFEFVPLSRAGVADLRVREIKPIVSETSRHVEHVAC